MCKLIFRQLGHNRIMLFRQQKHMAWSSGINVKNRDALVILINLFCLYLAFDNLAEDALLFLELLKLLRAHILYLLLQSLYLLVCHLLHFILKLAYSFINLAIWDKKDGC